MSTACQHRWDSWRSVVPSFDYAGRFVGADIAELHADEPTTSGWTRVCGHCGARQTATPTVPPNAAPDARCDETCEAWGCDGHDNPRTCMRPGCDNGVKTMGLCGKHYMAQRRAS